MTDKTHPRGFVLADAHVSGPLKAGITLEGVACKTFVMREALVADLLDAEQEADVSRPLTFAAALLARQLVSLGENKGPFTVGMLRRMKSCDWRILRAAQTELDGLGEDAPPGAETS